MNVNKLSRRRFFEKSLCLSVINLAFPSISSFSTDGEAIKGSSFFPFSSVPGIPDLERITDLLKQKNPLIWVFTGDSAKVGPSPMSSMNLLDIDSIQMLWLLRRMRDDGIYIDGRKMKNPPKLFLGAASSPFASDPSLQAIRDHKKVNAGAQFFQTNLVFEADRLDPWLEQLDKRNILDKVYILIGIAPLKSFKVAEYIHTKVPGVNLPDNILSRMEKAGEGAPEEGILIALELIESIKKKKGVNGIHIMSLGWESVVRRIVTDSGLLR